ncbi:MAG: sugar kinase [Eubacterium sp.]|nr:sugar kinase [Eubacterium sp.]
MDRGMNKVVIVKKKTRLEDLKRRYCTIEQARFYVEHMGASFDDYIEEDQNYQRALKVVRENANRMARVLEIDRDYIPNMIFGQDDIVIALGQDGLVANVMKYLDGQPLIGINPDAARWDGILLPFEAGDMESVLPKVIAKNFNQKMVSMGKAESKDGQVLYAVNDFFIGINNHTSARYNITFGGITENQSSSGVIVSTGLGMTGWHRSIMAEFRGMAKAFNLGNVTESNYEWDGDQLIFQVREPYPSRFTQADLVYGLVNKGQEIIFTSNMSENGIVFSDGILDDTIEFNAGMVLRVGLADRIGRLVIE